MSIDLSEELLSVREAAALLPGRPHVSTIYRWVFRGCRGIKLEHTLIGGRLFTSREALQRFADRVTAAAAGGPSPTILDNAAAVEAAERALAAEGL